MKRASHTVAFISFDDKILVRLSLALMRSICILSYASVTENGAKYWRFHKQATIRWILYHQSVWTLTNLFLLAGLSAMLPAQSFYLLYPKKKTATVNLLINLWRNWPKCIVSVKKPEFLKQQTVADLAHIVGARKIPCSICI